MMERYRSDTLRGYAGYWNAFECLVDAVCLIHPQPKASKKEKQGQIDQFLSKLRCKLSAGDITDSYCLVVDCSWAVIAT